MKIGIYITANTQWGGVYQYTHSLISALKKHDGGHRYVLFKGCEDDSFNVYEGDGWQVVGSSSAAADVAGSNNEGITIGLLKRARAKLGGTPLAVLKRTPIYRSIRDKAYGRILDEQFREQAIDLAVFPTHNAVAAFTDTPFISVVHDIQHHFQPEFPEVSADGELAEREWFFRNITKKAAIIVVDSAVGMEDIISIYKVPANRVKVLPFIAPDYTATPVSQADLDRVGRKYKLPPRYFFYPSQFWPHKNHELIIKALGLLKKQGIKPPVIFTGNKDYPYSTYDKIMALSSDLGVRDQLIYLGYVPGEDMPSLYKSALALVMPTFFGPTNIPVIEAFALDCPVITSDIRGIREQVGTAGLLVDPRDEATLARAMYNLETDQDLRSALIRGGRQKNNSWTETDFARELISVIDNVGIKDRGRSAVSDQRSSDKVE